MAPAVFVLSRKQMAVDLLKKRIEEIIILEREAANRTLEPKDDDDFAFRLKLLNSDLRQTIERVFGNGTEDSKFYFEGLPNFPDYYTSYIASGFKDEFERTDVGSGRYTKV